MFADVPPRATDPSVEPWLMLAIVVTLFVVAALASELTDTSREP